MSGNILPVLSLLLALVLSGAASTNDDPSPAEDEVKEANILQQLLARKDRLRDLANRQKQEGRSPPERTARRARVSEEHREMMTKQIMQAISEMMNSECMSDRDYQGWVDFGRRDAE